LGGNVGAAFIIVGSMHSGKKRVRYARDSLPHSDEPGPGPLPRGVVVVYLLLCEPHQLENVLLESQLKTAYLRRIIPRNLLKPIRDRLRDMGVVRQDLKIAPGVKSMGYQLTGEYRNTREILCTDPKLCRKIHRVYEEDNRAVLRVHRWLREKPSMVQFDLEKAYWLIRTMRPRRKKGRQPFTSDEYHTLLRELCQRIASGNWWFSVVSEEMR
jgi:hypothetical protein